MKILELETKKAKAEEEQHKVIQKCLADWSKMEDLQEILVISIIRNDSLRYQIPVLPLNNIYWTGVMDYLKDFFR